MSEVALLTARQSKLSTMAQRGDKLADAAIKLSSDPTRFLSTVQIGITSIGLLNGIVGEAILAEPFASWLQTQWPRTQNRQHHRHDNRGGRG